MNGDVTFIYASDLRLGAPVSGFCGLSPEWEGRLRRAGVEAYGRVVDAAVARDVDFIVFAGEILDAARPSYAEYRSFTEGLERLDSAGIPTYLVAGKHGLRASWAWEAERFPTAARLVDADDADALPVDLGLCRNLPSGAQACDAGDTGLRGCHLVQVDGEGARFEFIPTSSVVFERLEVDVSACQTLADVTHLVQVELLRESGKDGVGEVVACVELVGTTELHGYLAQADVVASLRKRVNAAHPSFFCDRLVDRTTREPAEGPFPKLVAEMAAEQRSRADVLINYAQSELVKRGVAVPSALASDVLEFNDAAEKLVLDLLRNQEGADE